MSTYMLKPQVLELTTTSESKLELPQLSRLFARKWCTDVTSTKAFIFAFTTIARAAYKQIAAQFFPQLSTSLDTPKWNNSLNVMLRLFTILVNVSTSECPSTQQVPVNEVTGCALRQSRDSGCWPIASLDFASGLDLCFQRQTGGKLNYGGPKGQNQTGTTQARRQRRHLGSRPKTTNKVTLWCRGNNNYKDYFPL